MTKKQRREHKIGNAVRRSGALAYCKKGDNYVRVKVTQRGKYADKIMPALRQLEPGVARHEVMAKVIKLLTATS